MAPTKKDESLPDPEYFPAPAEPQDAAGATTQPVEAMVRYWAERAFEAGFLWAIGGMSESDGYIGGPVDQGLRHFWAEQSVLPVSPEPATPESHRCSGCGHRWDGQLKGAELCGDCWRKAQPVLHVTDYSATELACRGCMGPCGRCEEPVSPAPPERREQDIDATLREVGIIVTPDKLSWVFRPNQVAVSSSGGTFNTRLVGLLQQVSYVIDGLIRQRESTEAALKEAQAELTTANIEIARLGFVVDALKQSDAANFERFLKLKEAKESAERQLREAQEKIGALESLIYEVVTGGGAQLENLDMTEAEWKCAVEDLGDDASEDHFPVTMTLQQWLRLIEIAKLSPPAQGATPEQP